jgi:nitroreductase
MEFNDVLDQRRMVRNFSSESVGHETINRIVEAGRRAPSAGNTQGQSFIVVTDTDQRKRLADLAGEASYVEQGFDPWISRAPVHILVCVSEQAYRDRYSEGDKTGTDDQYWDVPYWWVDAGASMQNILLAVVNEGLAGGFLGIHALDGVKEQLGIPTEVSPVGLVTVGHPLKDRPSGSLKRARVGQAVHWGKWSDAELSD